MSLLDQLRCPRMIAARRCNAVLLQLVSHDTAMAFLEWLCGYREPTVRRLPPSPTHWRSPSLERPCKIPTCPGIVTVRVSHPTRVLFCPRHTRAERKRVTTRLTKLAAAHLDKKAAA